MTQSNERARTVVRVSRPNRRPLNPEALGELLHRDLLEHDPSCVEVVVEIEEQAVDRLRERTDYRVDVVERE